MQYYEIPVDILENPDDLSLWAHKSLIIAKKKPAKKKRAKKVTN